MNVIRVFPRRTTWTPTDKLAFVGEPPLFRPADPKTHVHISCTFTWDKPEAERLYRSWHRFYEWINIGGPAYESAGGPFEPGMYIKPGMVMTSRGCSRLCRFCLVPSREGPIRELTIRDGWNVADNNLLACSEQHIENVFKMLRRQPEPATFSGGLDARLFNKWHVELLQSVRLKQAFFACDSVAAFKDLESVASLMATGFPRDKKRCYVLTGFNGESPEEAERRLEAVFNLGFLPYAMLYRNAEEKTRYSSEWARLVRLWRRPAAFKAHMKQVPA